MCILRVFFRFSLRSIVDPLENLGRKPGECWWLSFRTQAPTKKARRFNGGSGELNWKEMKRVVQRRWNKCFIWGICRVHERAANWWMDWAENLQKNGKRLGSEDLICRIASSRQLCRFFWWLSELLQLNTWAQVALGGKQRGRTNEQAQERFERSNHMSQVWHFSWWMFQLWRLQQAYNTFSNKLIILGGVLSWRSRPMGSASWRSCEERCLGKAGISFFFPGLGWFKDLDQKLRWFLVVRTWIN